jgi:hypothetical protein
MKAFYIKNLRTRKYYCPGSMLESASDWQRDHAKLYLSNDEAAAVRQAMEYDKVYNMRIERSHLRAELSSGDALEVKEVDIVLQ